MTDPISGITPVVPHAMPRITPGAELRQVLGNFNEFSSRLFGAQAGSPEPNKSLEKTLMNASSPNDVVGSLFVMSDMSAQVTKSVVRLTTSMAMGGAVTGLFSSLLKNRE